jgi:hypothetical protein
VRSGTSFFIAVAIVVSGVLSFLAIPARAQSLRAIQVFVTLGQKLDTETRHQYLREQAGKTVGGAGHLEVVMTRTYFDTSVPDSNPAVALIQVSPGRKVTCGLPQLLSREQLEELKEGTPVSFRGRLVDAQDWGEWSTIYLGDCSLHPR